MDDDRHHNHFAWHLSALDQGGLSDSFGLDVANLAPFLDLADAVPVFEEHGADGDASLGGQAPHSGASPVVAPLTTSAVSEESFSFVASSAVAPSDDHDFVYVALPAQTVDLERADVSTAPFGAPPGAPGPAGSLTTLANYLTTGFWDDFSGSDPRSYNLGTSGTGANSGILYFNVTGWTGNLSTVYGNFADSDGISAARADMARAAFAVYEEILGIDFIETTSESTAVDFFFMDNQSGAFEAESLAATGVMDYGLINVETGWSGGSSNIGGTNGYTFQTFLHEIGHALGLGHQGNYNAGAGSPTYDNSAQWANDSWQQTMMSYWSQADNTSITADYAQLISPMAVDWIALNSLYGGQGYGTSNAFNGNTIWGVGTNITNAVSEAFAGLATFAATNAFCIVDGSGNDTVDFSNYNVDQQINLAPSSAGNTSATVSNVGGLVGNMTIAEGTLIENATGGGGNDRIDGNNVANFLFGNDGNDTLYGYDGADSLYGGGNDDYLKGGGGADYLNGGAGVNTADYNTFAGTEGSVVDLAKHTVTGGDGQGDVIHNVQNLLGSGYADYFYGTSEANNLSGAAGNDYIDGYLGDDTLDGGTNTSGVENDVLSYYRDLGVSVSLSVTTGQATGGSGTDTIANFENLYGSFFNDRLTGNDGANYIYGAAGSDTIQGKGGNDTLQAGYSFAYIVKAASTHNNSIANAVSVDGVFNKAYNDNIDNSDITPHATVVATASGESEYYGFDATAGAAVHLDIDQTFLGTDTILRIFDANGTLLVLGDDSLIDNGSESDHDTSLNYTFATAGRYFVEVLRFGDETLFSGTQYTLNISLTGATVVTNTSGTILDGGDGDDSLIGYVGADTASYVDATSGVTVSLLSQGGAQNTGGAGLDTLLSIENLTGSVFGDILIGDGNTNILDGDIGDDVLDGGDNSDTLNGGDGNDTLWAGFDDGNGDANNGGDGIDTVLIYGTLVADFGFNIDLRTGTDNYNNTYTGIEVIVGGNVDDNLTGNALTVRLEGRGGDDTFKVFSSSTEVKEIAGEGLADRVISAVSYILADGSDIEFLTTNGSTGAAAINLTGNKLAQQITGNYGANVLRDGGGAADVLRGLNGNDTYQVYNSGTAILESDAAGGGTADRITAAVDYVLASGVGVEMMTTNGSTATSGIDLTGNKLAQEITGNYGANVLRDGGGAADVLRGLNGNDTYQVYNSATAIVESGAAGGGTADRVTAGVDYVLVSGVGVEMMTTNGSTGTSGIDLTGNDFVQSITGNAGSNILDGKGGNDTLQGLGGKDFFVFSSALGASNVDKVTDFNVADDTIRLENSVFTALTATGMLSASFFKDTILTPRDADDVILYNSNTGSLFYDADGLGGAAAVKFASLTAGLALTAADFVVI